MQDVIRRDIGLRLRDARKALKRSQQDVATELRIKRQSVSGWECGKTMPSAGEWYRLGPLYGVSLDYLVYGIRTIPVTQSPLLTAILLRRDEAYA